ncbi:MAG TPA: DUF192 domain-containing protein [Phycisphaerae bacterium]|nr:DUF192 domain-containing protein [Phycisphaerae bacterium]
MAAGVLACGGCKAARPATVTIGENTWNVELAITPEQQYKGLSGRYEIAPDGGMLFINTKEGILRFCMRDCHVPIDIVFINSAMEVVNVYEMQVEEDCSGNITYSSHLPALYALELAGGTIRRDGIKIGDKVKISMPQ